MKIIGTFELDGAELKLRRTVRLDGLAAEVITGAVGDTRFVDGADRPMAVIDLCALARAIEEGNEAAEKFLREELQRLTVQRREAELQRRRECHEVIESHELAMRRTWWARLKAWLRR